MKTLTACLLLTICSPQDPQEKAPQGIPTCETMQKTASGLEWGVLKQGSDAAPPTANDVVEVHYTGWLTDGTKFDSSRDRGQPAKFPLGGVIKGWTEGLQLMSPGARYKFVIPGDLAYGASGRPPKIGPNATLVFDVELLKVVRTPKLRDANPDLQKDGENGLKYEVCVAGKGAAVEADHVVSLRYAIWTDEGALAECSEQNDDHRIAGTLDSLPAPFLGEVLKGAKVGDVFRIEVPVAAFPRAQKPTIWEIEVTSTKPKPEAPKFRVPDPAVAVTTQSGLVYEVLEPGSGESPTAADTVVAHYTGWLTDGTKFDSSHERGEPTQFGLDRVIRGWTEGLQLMKPGAKFLFQIPPDLGYGPRGQPPTIPANATLVFFVELVEVKKN